MDLRYSINPAKKCMPIVEQKLRIENQQGQDYHLSMGSNARRSLLFAKYDIQILSTYLKILCRRLHSVSIVFIKLSEKSDSQCSVPTVDQRLGYCNNKVAYLKQPVKS